LNLRIFDRGCLGRSGTSHLRDRYAIGEPDARTDPAGRTGLPHGIENSAVIESPDPVTLALGMRPMQAASSGWTYNDAAVGLLSPILARAEGRDLRRKTAL